MAKRASSSKHRYKSRAGKRSAAKSTPPPKPVAEPSSAANPTLSLELVLLLVALALLVQGVLSAWPRTVDDAFITFRYSQNLVDGLGAVYNAGERVEGYTSLSWMLAAAAGIALGVDPVVGAKWSGLVASVLLLVAVYLGLRFTGVRRWGAALAAMVVGASYPVQIWSIAGMETTAYALFFFAGLMFLVCDPRSLRSVLLASVALVLAGLTRPEGVLYWALGLAVVFAGARKAPRQALAYALPGLGLVAHFAWRFVYYGALFPNTYYAKTGGGPQMWAQGWRNLTGFVTDPGHAVWLAAALVGLLVGLRRPATRRAAAIVGVPVLIHLAYVISVGGDGLFVHRFYVPIIAPLAFLIGLLFYEESPPAAHEGWLVPLAALAILLGATVSVVDFHQKIVPTLRDASLPYQEGNIKLGRILGELEEPDTLIATPSAGAVAFYSGLPIIDMYGLNDAHIARQPFPKGVPGKMMKWDNDYVLSRRPEIIVINLGYLGAGDPRIADAQRNPAMFLQHGAPMDRALLRAAMASGAYAGSTVSFDDGSQFSVLVLRNR